MPGSSVVLFVRDLFHPVNDLSVDGFLNSDMCHRDSRACAMPMLLIRLEPDLLAVQVIQKLFAAGAEEALDFPAALRVIWRRVHDEHADRVGDTRQLRASIDFRVVDVQPDGYARAAMAWRMQLRQASSR